MTPIGQIIEYQNIDFVVKAKILKRAKTILKSGNNIYTDTHDSPHFLAENIKGKGLVIVGCYLYFNRETQELEIKWQMVTSCYPKKDSKIAMIERESPGYKWD